MPAASGWAAPARAPPSWPVRTTRPRRPVEPVPVGERLTTGQRYAVEESIRKAELASRAEFSVYVGPVASGPASLCWPTTSERRVGANSHEIHRPPRRRRGGLWISCEFAPTRRLLGVLRLSGERAGGGVATLANVA